MSGDGAGDGLLGASWHPTVDVVWFEDWGSTWQSEVEGAAGQFEAAAAAPAKARREEPVDAVLSQWVVQLTPEATRRAGSVAGTAELLETDRFGTQAVRGLGLQGMVLLETDPSTDLSQVEPWLRGNPHVAYFEPDAALRIGAIPSDARFPELWGLHNTGQTGGTADADIDAPEAWEITTGSEGIVVGVIDSGVDFTHADLADNLWTNPGEVPHNGVDDDGNGFVDDVHGYDFINEDGDPLDDNGHGTHVTGVIAGIGDNARGVTGVTWAGSVMSLKFLDADGNGFTSDAVKALNYATMMRSVYGVDVRVTNNSWGGGVYSQALHDAILASGDAGILFVAAAGNDGVNTDEEPHFPSGYDLPNVIAVAASDHNDQLASFANYGAASVDLTAPGVNILSTLPGGTYGSHSGTSMATPHVAGVAALAWSVAADATVGQVRDALLAGVDPVGELDGLVATGGRLNARKTLEMLSIHVASSDPAAGSTVSSAPADFTVRFTHPFAPASVDGADLVVNGIAADGVVLVDSHAVTFQFSSSPVTSQGPQTMEIGQGTIQRAGNGDPISAWEATFYYDVLPLAVVSAEPFDGETLDAAPTEIVLEFNEPVDAQSVDRSDLLLSVGTVTAAAMLDDDSAAYTVTGLPREGWVTYTLSEGAVRDAYGTPGSGYAGSFLIDDPSVDRYAAGDVPKSITDFTTVHSTLTIEESFAIADLDVEIEIAHTYDADLNAYLIAPDGTRVLLFSGVGGAGNGFAKTVLDDEAETSITEGMAPFHGRYRPEEPLSSLDDSDALGTWTLEIRDLGGLDEGDLVHWALIVERGPELPPRIRFIDPLPPDGGQAWSAVQNLEVHFSRAMEPATVNDPTVWALLEAGTDGVFETADDVSYSVFVLPAYVDGLTARLETGLPQLPEGSYRLTAASGGLADLSGAALDGNSDGIGGDDYVTHFTVLPGDAYLSEDVPKDITDYNTIRSTLTVDESFPIADLDVKIDVTHTYDADLDVYLIAPDGTRLELFTDVGGSGDNFSGTVFDDEAEVAIAEGEAPFSGRYRPAQPLSGIDGGNGMGTWTLEIRDDGELDRGTLNGWAILLERGPEIAPQISSIAPLPEDGGETWGPLDRLEVRFSKPMEATAVNEASHWELLEAGTDLVFGTADDVDYPVTVAPPYEGGLTATLETGVPYLPAGSYRLKAASGGLADQFGKPLDGNSDGTGGDDYVTHFTVLPGFRYVADGVPREITDNGTITSTLAIEDSFPIADLEVQIDIAHSYDADLDVYLTAPDGTRIELFTDVGGSGDDFAGTILDDQAATPIGQGRAPFSGRFRPEGVLSVVNGSNISGAWTLEISDDAQRDQGTLLGWALIAQPDPVLPPRITGHAPRLSGGAPVPWVRVTFDRPMDTASFSLVEDVVRFEGPQGGVIPSGYVWVDLQTLEIQFDPQSGVGEYVLTLGPAILDAGGIALDQDGDGFPGEVPDDQYAAAFVIAEPLGEVDFVALADLAPSAGGLWYRLETTRRGLLTFEALAAGGETTDLSVYDAELAEPPLARSSSSEGRSRIDWEVSGPGEVYYLRLAGEAGDVDLHVVNLVDELDNVVNVYATPGDDRFEVTVAAPIEVAINEVAYEFDPAEVSEVAFAGGEGSDLAVFHGGGEDELVRLWPDHGVFVGPGLTVTASGIESAQATGGGGGDTARLYDDPTGEDLFEATPSYASLSGSRFANRVEGFPTVYAFATAGGGDVAELYDDPSGSDVFVSKPTFSLLYGDAFYNRALYFAEVRAFATVSSGDLAKLYDDPSGDELLEATPEYATLTGNGFSARAESFRYLYSYATPGGHDVARLHDDPEGADTFVAKPEYALLVGDEFHQRVFDFAEVHGFATEGGSDVARLYGTAGVEEMFEATPEYGTLSGNGVSKTAHSFRYLYAYGTPGGGDSARLWDDPNGADLFVARPGFGVRYGDGFYNRASGFEEIQAFATEGGDDLAKLYDAPNGDDRLVATPEYATFSGAGFSNRADSFRYVYAYATAGDEDQATLSDDPATRDTFVGKARYSLLSGDGFYNRVIGFRDVVARATEGGIDVARLFDDPFGKDQFEATPDHGVLTGNGFSNRVESFRYVTAYGTPGGGDVARLYDDPAEKDTFAARPGYAVLSSDRFFSRALNFGEVSAYATEGGRDVARFYDDPGGDDLFEATPLYATFFGGGSVNRAESFRYVYAYATPGGLDVAKLYDSALDDLLEADDNWARLSSGPASFANLVVSFKRVEATLSNPGDAKDIGSASFLIIYEP